METSVPLLSLPGKLESKRSKAHRLKSCRHRLIDLPVEQQKLTSGGHPYRVLAPPKLKILALFSAFKQSFLAILYFDIWIKCSAAVLRHLSQVFPL